MIQLCLGRTSLLLEDHLNSIQLPALLGPRQVTLMVRMR